MLTKGKSRAIADPPGPQTPPFMYVRRRWRLRGAVCCSPSNFCSMCRIVERCSHPRELTFFLIRPTLLSSAQNISACLRLGVRMAAPLLVNPAVKGRDVDGPHLRCLHLHGDFHHHRLLLRDKRECVGYHAKCHTCVAG